ncbi:MAG: QueT transporter family protein [Clostridia bacterium]|nr:QueT transporter family protein [Clostridia bacterium]
MKKSVYVVHSAVIAAIYIVITWIFAPISFGHNIFQLRVSEALCVLPLFTPGAIFGLFAGCFLSNLLFGGLGIIDLIFGSLATLAGAAATYALRRKNPLIALFPPVIINAVVVGGYLKYLLFTNISAYVIMGYTFLGEFLACYVLGYPLFLALKKHADKIFGVKF